MKIVHKISVIVLIFVALSACSKRDASQAEKEPVVYETTSTVETVLDPESVPINNVGSSDSDGL